MYSYEDRIKAVKLFISYDLSIAATIHELGYPSRNALRQWHKEYIESGKLHKRCDKKPKHSIAQKEYAVNYYMEHGRNIARTIRIIGYPRHRETFGKWLDELAPNERKVYLKHSSMVNYTSEQQKAAVILSFAGNNSIVASADSLGVSRASLYKWKNKLLGEGCGGAVKRRKRPVLPDNKDILASEVEMLKEQIYQLQMEYDILEKAAEVLKKDQGINPIELANAEKTSVIDALRRTYSLKELLKKLGISKSSCFYQKKVQDMPDRYICTRIMVKEIFEANKSRYGYRRIHALIKNSGSTVSEKVIRRIMKEEELTVPLRKKRRYCSYRGEISPAVENIIARDFRADAPNKKWLTDLTEFHIPAGKIYLSSIVDCFDGMVVSWTIGTSPDAELVNTMLDYAICNLSEDERPILHSDREWHYRWSGWISRTENNGLIRSMSRKGCSPDNSACEGFFAA